MHSAADPTESRRFWLLQPFVGTVQNRIQRLERQLLAGQWSAQSADAEQSLQGQVWPAVTRQSQLVLRRRVQYVPSSAGTDQLHASRGWVLGQRRSWLFQLPWWDDVHHVWPWQRPVDKGCQEGQLRSAYWRRILAQSMRHSWSEFYPW